MMGQPLKMFQWTKLVHAHALVLPRVTNTFYRKVQVAGKKFSIE